MSMAMSFVMSTYKSIPNRNRKSNATPPRGLKRHRARTGPRESGQDVRRRILGAMRALKRAAVAPTGVGGERAVLASGRRRVRVRQRQQTRDVRSLPTGPQTPPSSRQRHSSPSLPWGHRTVRRVPSPNSNVPPSTPNAVAALAEAALPALQRVRRSTIPRQGWRSSALSACR